MKRVTIRDISRMIYDFGKRNDAMLILESLDGSYPVPVASLFRQRNCYCTLKTDLIGRDAMASE